ncbi:2-dehydropantoate 2-reductase [Sphingomonas sp. BN140010]|uniref:2-dehydropantoate 2-reductase n=1 Tax=Sphingomonas arvum TaxID=2992113 RepID=A0ABT3JAX9_9SPHN|nr:2-dehydropantoate 2-reductase [Sphingomonas sp. BN140010]MCW3796232.1 2-dehydropantoate 2-reductase [Sphingomonas sp. BN140010]
MSEPRIVVAGAGSIGCYVGGLLAAAGRHVTLLCRERIAAGIRDHGLHLTSLDGLDLHVGAGALTLATDPQALATADLVLVTVKSGATREMARLIAAHAPSEAAVVSLQNGIGNAAALRAELPHRPVLAGMIPFNVVHAGEGRFHRGTSGAPVIEAGRPDLTRALSVPHLAVETSADMAAVLWGKLLINLNNALNALSGLTLHEQLQQRPWRKLLAAQQREALSVLAIAGTKPWSMGPLPVRLLPWVLRLPTPLFRMMARSAVRIDRRARSSMWEDLERRRPTEIDELQGAVVDLAARFGRDVPVNRRVREAIKQAEAAGAGSPHLRPVDLR